MEAQATPPTPTLSLSVNGSTDAEGYQGWALIFRAALVNPQRFTPTVSVTPLLINPLNGSWANTIQLVVTDSNGVAQNWPIHLANAPSGSLTLDAMTTGRLAWFVAPSDTTAIGAGTYNVTAVLDTTTSAGTTGWSGSTSDSVSLQIGVPPAPATIDQQEEQAELLATYDHLFGNDTQALADIGAFLNQQPGDIGALAFQANLLTHTGQTANALSAYDEAVANFFAANTAAAASDQPDSLLIPENRARAALLSQSVGSGAPQASIQLQDQGTAAAGVFFLDLQITNVGNDVAQNVLLNHLAFQTMSGTGQVTFNSVLSPHFPVGTDFLDVNGTATIRFYITAVGPVGTFTVTENGTIADVFGTPTSFSQTQNVTLNYTGTGTPNPLTITVQNATKQYGQATPPLNNVTYNGFVNGDTPASLMGVLSCTTTATQASPVGSYPISCIGLNSPNYIITYVAGTLTITTAPLTVTANNTSKSFGQPNPVFTVSYNGFVNGDTAASLGGLLTCTTTATQTSPAGMYPITCSGQTSTNYTISYVPGQLTVTPVIGPGNPPTGDFFGDGKADFAVFRPSNGTWYVLDSNNSGKTLVQQWGSNGDIPVRGDYDGDGKTDFAVWRPLTGEWFVILSSNPGTPTVQQWGTLGDIPVPGDYDGDGKTDFAVWRPSTGTWFIIPSSNPGSPIVQQWGTNGDIPVTGDFDGDKKTDFALFRPSNGTWYIVPSSNPASPIVRQWGTNGDLPVTGDYDGDGKADMGVFRPSVGTWFIIPSGNPGNPIVQQWGMIGDIPVPVDYDGDGKTDIGVWRPSEGNWYVMPSSTPGTFTVTQWGTNADAPIEKPIGQ